jgi:acyl carrier protein
MDENKLTEMLEEILEVPRETIDEDAELRQFPDWDSLKHVRLVVGLQTAYGVELDRDEIAQLTSLSRIRRVLQQRRQCNGSRL